MEQDTSNQQANPPDQQLRPPDETSRHLFPDAPRHKSRNPGQAVLWNEGCGPKHGPYPYTLIQDSDGSHPVHDVFMPFHGIFRPLIVYSGNISV
jgi:hypothetical protein